MGQKKDIEVYAGIPEANTKSVSIDMQYSHAKTGASYFINDTEVRFSLPATYFQKDLVALYHFEENSYSGAADEVVDSSGNGYHGFAVSGATTSNTGKMGRALFVDESYVNSSIIVPASDFSVSMWYRIDNTLLTDGPGPAGMTLLEGTVDDGGSGLFYIDLDETGPWMYSIAGVNFFDGAATESLAADYVETATHDQWYHFAAVRDNATHITLYRNGVEVGTGTNQNVGYYTISNIVLGSASDGFIGYIDEVAIWSRALSADDIESIYQYGN
ncbi:MAG: LamG domain-containing protein [Nanoarchaeota archaeon]